MHETRIDMMEGILQGLVTSMFPDIQHLYCVRHLMQRDEQKINCLLQKFDCRENERLRPNTAQKMKFSIEDLVWGLRKLRIWSYLLKKFLMENFIFCVV